MKKFFFEIWFWYTFKRSFSRRSPIDTKFFVLLCAALAFFIGMTCCFYRGHDAGVVDGMNAGFEAGYKMKKPPVIIVTPPKDDMFVPSETKKDSVRWRI